MVVVTLCFLKLNGTEVKNSRYPKDWDIGGKINREKDEWNFEIPRVFEISVHKDLNSIWTTKQNDFTMAVNFSNLQVLPPTRLGCSWHQCRCGRYHWSVHHTCCCLLFHEILDTDPINSKLNTGSNLYQWPNNSTVLKDALN